MYLRSATNKSGAYGAPQSKKSPGLLELPDRLLGEFLSYNGFVTLTTVGDTITAVTPNTESWEAWKATLPPEVEPSPTEAEQLRADIDYLAAIGGITL